LSKFVLLLPVGTLMKNKVLLSLFVLFSVLSCTVARAQYLDPRFAIYLTSPIGILSKGGLMAEYRLNQQNALLLGYSQYWGFFPGYQGTFEYRMYFPVRKSNSENFIYAKAGLGYAGYDISQPAYTNISSLGDGRSNDAAPGTYVFGGGGIGRHINFDWFFIELNAGLKFSQVTSAPHLYDERLFYLTGPGSYADFNFHFGVQF